MVSITISTATKSYQGTDARCAVAHRIIVKEVSQTPPPSPIISVTHVRADENER
jgi:hypothetical protein